MEDEFITLNNNLKELIEFAKIAAKTDYNILLLGETGVGKGRFAERIHKESNRAGMEFKTVNCGALTQTLIESQLFGHKKGSFTDAKSDYKGVFETADGGTLFLDEVGELPLGTQQKLLRAIQYGMIQPLGSENEKKVNVRLICATNRDILQEIKEGKFRMDLYYRISTVKIKLPSLRERGYDDIKYWIEKFLQEENNEAKKNGLKEKEILENAWDVIFKYEWPGNLRELKNFIKRAILWANYYKKEIDKDLADKVISEEDFYLLQSEGTSGYFTGINLRELLKELEREFIEKALFISGKNQVKAAKYLGITQQNLSNKIKKYKINK
jgi:transcriptional regulator with GAF, ATPase, and Fis domain